jgi:hypothetical protein
LRSGEGQLPAGAESKGRLLLVLSVGVVVRQARRDIIDVRSRIILEIIDRIDAAARTFLDRAARLVILLGAFLVPQAPGRRRGTEVRAAIASTGSRRPAWSARCETTAATTRPWAAEATTAAWTRAAESAATTTSEATAAGARAAEAATARAWPAEAGSWWTWATILAGTRFAHREWAPLEWLRVELTNDFFGLLAVCKLDECKSARTTGLPIDRHGDVGRLCDGREVCPEIGLARAVGEVSDEQTDCQGLLVKSPLL